MWFKTKKIKTSVDISKIEKKQNTNFFIYFLWFIWIIFIAFLWTYILWSIRAFDFNLWNIVNNISVIKPDKNKVNKISILVVWRWWWNHDAPNLTDSMILVSLDLNKNIVSMLSIPRDFYVKKWENSYWKLNEIYAYSLQRNDRNENKAMWDLKNKISEITWEKVNYYVNIDFEGFKAIVDMLWWVEIEVEKDLYDNSYPTPNWWYTTFILKKWTWTLDWETALKYARSRHSTSDFDRSLRQQKIISAVKDKVLSGWYLTSPSKIKDLYKTASPYFKTDIDLNWIIKLLSDYKDLSELKQIISVNLNNTCYYNSPNCSAWWFLYNPPMANFWWASVVIPNWTTWYKDLEKYDEIQKFSNILFNYPWVFVDKQEINIFYTWSMKNDAWDLSNSLKQYWFSFPEKNYIWNTWTGEYNNTTIYYNNLWENTSTLEALKLFIKWNYIESNLPKISENPNTRFEVIIWDDYKEVINFKWTWSTNP